jgi:hypothetical protein
MKTSTRTKPGRNVMTKVYAVAALASMLIGATVNVAAAPPTGVKNVVLVHGAFADGSGWEAVAKILEKDGYKVSVAQPPETGLHLSSEGNSQAHRRGCHLRARQLVVNRSLRLREKHVLRTGRSGLVRGRSTLKLKRSEELTTKENSHERAY